MRSLSFLVHVVVTHVFLLMGVAVTLCAYTSPSEAKPMVRWSPSSLSAAITAGETTKTSATFTASEEVSEVTVWVVPEIAPYLTVSPSSFAHVTKGASYTLDFAFAAPAKVPVRTLHGTIHLRTGTKTLARPLPVELTFTPTTSESFSIRDVTPDAVLPGETATVLISRLPGTGPVVARWGGLSIDTSAGGNPLIRTFPVPAEAKSAPLVLRQGDTFSNSIFLAVSETRVLRPSPAEIVTVEEGVEMAVNQVIVYFRLDVKDPESQIARLAGAFGAQVVGRIPLLKAYQLRFPAITDVPALNAVIVDLEADPEVERALPNLRVQDEDQADWSADPGIDGVDPDTGSDSQRSQNCVEEGALLYTKNVDPLASGSLRPVFVSIHEADEDVDFDDNDFSGYSNAGVNRSNNIAIFSNDAADPTSHGTTVTGVMAAELGDAGNAGLLQGLLTHHGGINIETSREDDFLASRGASNVRALENGARVLNWSFGIHRRGARDANGNEVTNNARSAKVFEDFQSQSNLLITRIEDDYPNVVVVASA
ncbi:MAG: hypothetical protein U9R74_16470, partial [Pseudomonadota bacterium]|nr:hypothetical protein [Pseudomonadota bacterium]